MKYENKVIVFQVGANLNSYEKQLKHIFKECKLSMHNNRRYTLKIGDAIRIRKLDKDTEFINCRIFMEGTLSDGRIIPFGKYKCAIHYSAK